MSLFNDKKEQYFVLETPKSDKYDAIIFINGKNSDRAFDDGNTLNKFLPETILVIALYDAELWGGLLGNEKGLIKITGNSDNNESELNIENSIKILNNVYQDIGVELVRKDGFNNDKKNK